MEIQIIRSGRCVRVVVLHGGAVVENVVCNQHLSEEDALELAREFYGVEGEREAVPFRDGPHDPHMR